MHQGNSMKMTAAAAVTALLLCACSGGNSAPEPNAIPAPLQQAEPAVAAPSSQPPEILIPRSMPGDKGQYYLLERSRNGDIVSATHKRVGVDSVAFTKTETNCSTMQMREIGYSETSVAAIESQPTDWFDLVSGSSKADLAAFICKQ